MVSRHLKSISILFSLLLLFSCLCPLTGCGGGSGSTGNVPFSGGSGGGGQTTTGNLQVTVPFTGQSSLTSGMVDLSTINYYLVDLYTQGTTTPVATQQNVPNPGGGASGTGTFSSVTPGTYSLSTRGYDLGGALRVWSDSTATITAGSTATAAPTQTSITPTGFTSQAVTLTTGAASVTVNNFGASNEAMVFVNYNSATPDALLAHNNNLVTATTAVTSLVGNLASLITPSKSVFSAKPAPAELNFPMRDIDIVTEGTATCLEKFGLPKPVTKAEKIALGLMDENGNILRAAVNDTKNINIINNSNVWTDGVACTCRYANTNVAIWVDNHDWEVGGNGSVTQTHVNSIGDFFQGTTWTKAATYFNVAAPGLRWGGSQFNIVISDVVDDNGGNAYFYAVHEYPFDAVTNPHSNQMDSVYCCTTFSFAGQPTVTEQDWQGVISHEFQHYLRWYEKVFVGGAAQADQSRLDAPINEGLSQYFECYVGRGLLNGPAFSQWLRTDNMNQYLGATEAVPIVTSGGGGRMYSAGFMTVFYLLDHYGGLPAINKLEKANTNVALNSIQEAAGESLADFFLKYCMALNLANRAGMTSAFTFSSIDITGATTYNGVAFHPSWYYDDNVGAPTDYSRGIDMQTAGNNYNINPNIIEWAAEQYRFYNGRGNTLTLNLSNFNPNVNGGGNFTIFVINK